MLACLKSQCDALALPFFSLTPPFPDFGGSPDFQVAGPYIAFLGYGVCGKQGNPCGGPFA